MLWTFGHSPFGPSLSMPKHLPITFVLLLLLLLLGYSGILLSFLSQLCELVTTVTFVLFYFYFLKLGFTVFSVSLLLGNYTALLQTIMFFYSSLFNQLYCFFYSRLCRKFIGLHI